MLIILMQPTQAISPLSQAVIGIALMVILVVLGAELFSGVLLRATAATPISTTFGTPMALFPVPASTAATVNVLVPLSAASGIDHLSIRLLRGRRLRRAALFFEWYSLFKKN